MITRAQGADCGLAGPFPFIPLFSRKPNDATPRTQETVVLNGHPPGPDGQMATALKRYNGGRVLVFVMGAFA